ncbi:MAG: efflux transporter periplasmic adaptor subunit [Methylotenera sp.]|jgi:cobalt-zinc-cadmium efflux system membrane fusion protein|nr:MAG: efflux transporter periplasmic adaptor subunit [Methylotenera sp.]
MNLNYDKSSKKYRQVISIILVIIITIVLGGLILKAEKPKAMTEEHEEHSEGESHSDHEEGMPKESLGLNSAAIEAHEKQHTSQPQEVLKGPHGGKLFVKDNYGVEIAIFEEDTPPEFRIYTYLNEKALDPAQSKVSVELERLGRKPEKFSFVKEKNYLKSTAPVAEPHSFDVHINVFYGNKNYAFSFKQVEGRVSMSDKQMTLNAVEVLTAGPAKIKSTLKLQGEIKLNADKSVQIVPRVGGIVEKVSVNAGDKVRKGQVLATVSSQMIADVRSDLLAAQKRAGLARTTYEREKQLWEEKISAQQDYLQAQHDLQEAEINLNRIQQKLGALGAGASGSGQARYDIRSPIDGVVTLKKVSQGQVVSEIDSLFEVSDLSTVWAEMTIYAKDINTVKTGQQVTVKASAFDAQAVGSIAYVGSLVGEQSRTAMARVVLNNPDKTWLPGLPVNIELTSNEVDVPLAVSVEGIQSFNEETVVFGRYGSYFEARPITLGRRDDKYVEVLEGLNIGEKYAAGNSYLIKADIGKAGASHEH